MPVGRWLIAPVALLACACSAPAAKSAGAPAPETAPVVPGHGSVVGTVRVLEDQPTIVVLDPVTPREFPPPEATPVLDQDGMQFYPSVLFVRTGQPVDFLNHDEHLHNVDVRESATWTQMFNVVIPTGARYTFTFDHDGFYDVTCDAHQFMRSIIIATSTPYATASEDGHFAFNDVDSGEYTLRVTAAGKTAEQTVAVPSEGTATVDVSVRGS